MQKIIKTSIIWIIFMLGCCGCQKKEQPIQELEEIGSEKSETSKQEETKEKKTIYVYVCGAVMQAGVYELQQDSRVYEAIQKQEDLQRMRIYQRLIKPRFCRMKNRFMCRQRAKWIIH